MDGDDFGRLIYLVLMVCVIGGYFLLSGRQKLGETARQAALWGLIFVGTIAGVALWSDLKDTIIPRQSVSQDTGRISIPRSPDGHYHLTMTINGQDVDFIVDTGATNIVLSTSDAERIGLEPEQLIYSGRANTANGEVRTAQVTLDDVQLDGIDEGPMRVMVNAGELDTSLLGMTYLERFGRIEITNGRLLLEP